MFSRARGRMRSKTRFTPGCREARRIRTMFSRARAGCRARRTKRDRIPHSRLCPNGICAQTTFSGNGAVPREECRSRWQTGRPRSSSGLRARARLHLRLRLGHPSATPKAGCSRACRVTINKKGKAAWGWVQAASIVCELRASAFGRGGRGRRRADDELVLERRVTRVCVRGIELQSLQRLHDAL